MSRPMIALTLLLLAALLAGAWMFRQEPAGCTHGNGVSWCVTLDRWTGELERWEWTRRQGFINQTEPLER